MVRMNDVVCRRRRLPSFVCRVQKRAADGRQCPLLGAGFLASWLSSSSCWYLFIPVQLLVLLHVDSTCTNYFTTHTWLELEPL
jgi:hypothetical protein